MARGPLPGGPAWERYLDRRFSTVLESIPGRADLRPGGDPGRRLEDTEPPNWLRVPIWLDASWSRAPAEGVPGSALGEILWGQYALFLAIRLQDDLLDGQRDDLRLLYVADRFLLESLESFQRLPVLGEGFWSFYRGCLRGTVDGILEVGRLEKEPGGFQTEHLGLHARVSGIFKVGAAAVCRLHGREGDAGWLSRVQDQLAIVSQIGDDLDDLPGDLKGGRYTWVGNTMLAAQPGEVFTTEELAGRLGEGLLRPERGETVVEELRRAARAAAEAVPGSAPLELHDLVGRLGDTSDALERRMHEARVRSVFGDLLESATP